MSSVNWTVTPIKQSNQSTMHSMRSAVPCLEMHTYSRNWVKWAKVFSRNATQFLPFDYAGRILHAFGANFRHRLPEVELESVFNAVGRVVSGDAHLRCAVLVQTSTFLCVQFLRMSNVGPNLTHVSNRVIRISVVTEINRCDSRSYDKVA